MLVSNVRAFYFFKFMRKINTLILLLSAAVSLSAQSVDITFVRGGGKSETKTAKPEKISPDT